MATYPGNTTGVGVAAKILVAGTENSGATTPGYNDIVLSLSGANGLPTSFQLNPQLVDADGSPVEPGTVFTLSAVAASSGGTAVYTGTITGGGSPAFVGDTFVVAGFAAANNNGTFLCTASTTTTLTLENADATAVTAAGTATEQETTNSLTYRTDGSASYTQGTYNPGSSPTRGTVVSVSASGDITTNGVTGTSVVGVDYPIFNSGNVATGKISAQVNVTVVV